MECAVSFLIAAINMPLLAEWADSSHDFFRKHTGKQQSTKRKEQSSNSCLWTIRSLFGKMRIEDPRN
jgi:hypothetical protein